MQTQVDFTPPPPFIRPAMPNADRQRRMRRMEAQEARKRDELALRERELAIREAELAARNAPTPAPDTTAPETLEAVLGYLYAVSQGTMPADAVRVRASEAYLRARGAWGVDTSQGEGESATLRQMMGSLPAPAPVKVNPEQPADDKPNQINDP